MIFLLNLFQGVNIGMVYRLNINASPIELNSFVELPLYSCACESWKAGVGGGGGLGEIAEREKM